MAVQEKGILTWKSMEDIINARCGWAGTDELYIKYHDEEWGKPVTDDKTLFEFLVLESAQGRLSLDYYPPETRRIPGSLPWL